METRNEVTGNEVTEKEIMKYYDCSKVYSVSWFNEWDDKDKIGGNLPEDREFLDFEKKEKAYDTYAYAMDIEDLRKEGEWHSQFKYVALESIKREIWFNDLMLENGDEAKIITTRRIKHYYEANSCQRYCEKYLKEANEKILLIACGYYYDKGCFFNTITYQLPLDILKYILSMSFGEMVFPKADLDKIHEFCEEFIILELYDKEREFDLYPINYDCHYGNVVLDDSGLVDPDKITNQVIKSLYNDTWKEVVPEMVSKGYKLNRYIPGLETWPLRESLTMGNPEMIKFLIANGASVNFDHDNSNIFNYIKITDDESMTLKGYFNFCFTTFIENGYDIFKPHRSPSNKTFCGQVFQDLYTYLKCVDEKLKTDFLNTVPFGCYIYIIEIIDENFWIEKPPPKRLSFEDISEVSKTLTYLREKGIRYKTEVIKKSDSFKYTKNSVVNKKHDNEENEKRFVKKLKKER